MGRPPALPAGQVDRNTCTQTPGCDAPARLYASGWACEDHKPYSQLLRRKAGTALDSLVEDGSWDAAFALSWEDQGRPIETVNLPESDSES